MYRQTQLSAHVMKPALLGINKLGTNKPHLTVPSEKLHLTSGTSMRHMFMQASGGGALDGTAAVCVLAEQSGVLHAADTCLARHAAIIHFKASISYTAGTAVLNNTCLSACLCLRVTITCQQLLAACLCYGASHPEWSPSGRNITMNLRFTC